MKPVLPLWIRALKPTWRAALFFLAFIPFLVFLQFPRSKEHIDTYFYDFFTRLAVHLPDADPSEPLVWVVELSPQTGDYSPHLLAAIKKVQAQHPKSIYFPIFYNHTSLESQDFRSVLSAASQAPNVFGYAQGFCTPQPNVLVIPETLQNFHRDGQRLWASFLSARERSHSPLRSILTHCYEGRDRLDTFPFAFQHQREDPQKPLRSLTPLDPFMRLEQSGKYAERVFLDYNKHTATIADTDLNPQRPSLKDKVVLIAYREVRDWPFATEEQLRFFSPFDDNLNNYLLGRPIQGAVSLALDHWYHDRFLRQVSWPLEVGHAVLVGGLTLYLAATSTLLGLLGILVLWASLLFLHSWLILEVLDWFFPFADTFILTLSGLILGLFSGTEKSLGKKAEKIVALQLMSDLEKQQEKILASFMRSLRLLLKRLFYIYSRIRWRPQADPQIIHAYTTSLKDFSAYLDQLNQMSKLKNFSQKEQTFRTVRLHDFIQTEVISKVSPYLDRKNLQIVMQIPEGYALWTNPEVLRHILYNLILNACQHSPDNEVVTIYATKHPFWKRPLDAIWKRFATGGLGAITDPFCAIFICDEGAGVPLPFQKKIFEKFYTVRSSRGYSSQGTGLGLYLCRFFAEKVGAQVSYERRRSLYAFRRRHKGACFCLKI